MQIIGLTHEQANRIIDKKPEYNERIRRYRNGAYLYLNDDDYFDF